MYRRFLLAIFASMIFLAHPVSAQTPDTLAQIDETLTHFVNDYAQIISSDVEAQLENELDAFLKKTDHTIVIATTPSLDGMHEQQFAHELFNKWKIGRADVDNGLLVLVAPNERAVWIEVGYGLEGVVPDLIASSIARTIMVPEFASGNYEKGITDGVSAIEKAAQGELIVPKEKDTFKNDFFIMLLIMTATALFVGAMFILFLFDNRKRIWPSVCTGVIAGIFDAFASLVFQRGLIYVAIIIGVFTFLAYLFARWLKKIQFDPTKYHTSGGGGSSGGSSGDSSFSGHTGGSSGGGGGGARW